MVLWTRPSYNMLSSWTAWRIPLGLVAVPTCSSHSNPTVAVELGRYPCKWSKMMVAVTNISPRKIAYVEIKTVFFVCRIPCWWRVLSVSCLQEWDNYSKFIEIHLQTLQKIHMFFRASTHIILPVPPFVTTKMLCAFHFPNRAVLLATLSAIMASRYITSCGVIYHFQ